MRKVVREARVQPKTGMQKRARLQGQQTLGRTQEELQYSARQKAPRRRKTSRASCKRRPMAEHTMWPGAGRPPTSADRCPQAAVGFTMRLDSQKVDVA